MALQQNVAWASTLLQQLTTQTAEQRQLVDKKLADLACQVDKKLKEVDMAITSMSTSISLMEDSLILATLVLPRISDVKGWVTDAVATERLAAGFPTAPPPNPPVAMVPSPCSSTEQGLAAMELNLAANSRAQDAWARAPRDPSLGVNTESYSPAGKAWSDEVPDQNWHPTGGPHCNGVHLGSAGHEPEPERWDCFLRNKDGSRYGPPGDHTHGCSGHEYADAYKHTTHGSWNGHKFGNHRPDRGFDRSNHREFKPRSSPRLPSTLDLQLFQMELALSGAARDWHRGYQGLVADGVRELTEGDLQALHVPLDTRLSIIDTHFKIMSAYTRHDSYNRPGPNLGGARKYTDWPKLMHSWSFMAG